MLIPFNQSEFVDQYSLFLKQLDQKEVIPDQGYCSGLSFMLFRDNLSIDPQTRKRLITFHQCNNEEIIKLGKLFNTFNINLRKEINKQLPALQEEINRLTDKNQQRLIREKHYNALMEKVLTNFSPDERETIQFLNQLYYFTNSLLFAQLAQDFELHTQDKRVLSQNNWLALLKLMPLEEWIGGKKITIPVRKVFSFVFNFRDQNELCYALTKSITSGDYIRISSIYHTIYFTYLNGAFKVFDANNGFYELSTLEELVNLLIRCFYIDRKVDVKQMTLCWDIFNPKYIPTRIKPRVLFENMLKHRGKNKAINAQDVDSSTALWAASREDNRALVKCLLSHHADPNIELNDHSTPLSLAADFGHIEIMNMLLKAKAEIKLSDSPLKWACIRNNVDAVKILLERGANPNHETFEIFGYALVKGYIEIVTLLLAYHADPNRVLEGLAVTPLYFAVQVLDTSLIDLLLSHGAHPNIATCAGMTPLHLASQQGDVMIIKKLLAHGADINQVDQLNHSPLFYAVSHQRAEVVKLLLEQHADLTLRHNTHQVNPLLLAVTNNDYLIAKLLINSNANRLEKNALGQSALRLALANQNWAIVISLLAALPATAVFGKTLKDDLVKEGSKIMHGLVQFKEELADEIKFDSLKKNSALSLLFNVSQNQLTLFQPIHKILPMPTELELLATKPTPGKFNGPATNC